MTLSPMSSAPSFQPPLQPPLSVPNPAPGYYPSKAVPFQQDHPGTLPPTPPYDSALNPSLRRRNSRHRSSAHDTYDTSRAYPSPPPSPHFNPPHYSASPSRDHLAIQRPRGYSSQELQMSDEDLNRYRNDPHDPPRHRNRSHRRSRSTRRRGSDYTARGRTREKSLVDVFRGMSLGGSKSRRRHSVAVYYGDDDNDRDYRRRGSSSRRHDDYSRHSKSRGRRGSYSSSESSSSYLGSRHGSDYNGRVPGERRAAMLGSAVGTYAARKFAKHRGWGGKLPALAGMVFGGVAGKELKKMTAESEERRSRYY